MASSTPAQFRAGHGDMGCWQAVDFEIYEHLVENQYVVGPGPWPTADRPPTRQDPDPTPGYTPDLMIDSQVSGPCLVDRDERAIRRVGSPRVSGVAFSGLPSVASFDSQPDAPDDSAAD